MTRNDGEATTDEKSPVILKQEDFNVFTQFLNDAGFGQPARLLREDRQELSRLLRLAVELLDTTYMKQRVEGINAPEDPYLEQVCETYGYGAVMDSACRQWYRKYGGSAHSIGHCFTVIDNFLKEAKEKAAPLFVEEPDIGIPISEKSQAQAGEGRL